MLRLPPSRDLPQVRHAQEPDQPGLLGNLVRLRSFTFDRRHTVTCETVGHFWLRKPGRDKQAPCRRLSGLELHLPRSHYCPFET